MLEAKPLLTLIPGIPPPGPFKLQLNTTLAEVEEKNGIGCTPQYQTKVPSTSALKL
jgi:hypothetical protein